MARSTTTPIEDTTRAVLAERATWPDDPAQLAAFVRDVLAELGLEYRPDPEDDNEAREDDAPERDEDDAPTLVALPGEIDRLLRALSRVSDDLDEGDHIDA